MKIIELFSGTESFSKVARERGHQTFTIEINPQFKPDLVKNILDLNVKDIPKEFRNPDVIWASPPCTTFSCASIGCYWNYGIPKKSKTYIGLALALKTLEIIQELKPKYWFIENPMGLLRKQHFIVNLNRATVTYCQYGDSRMKPTDIWNNCGSWTPKPKCKNGMPCHTAAPRGSYTGTQGLKGNKERSVIPPKLCLEILKACEKEKDKPNL